jgi:hypothetical protein
MKSKTAIAALAATLALCLPAQADVMSMIISGNWLDADYTATYVFDPNLPGVNHYVNVGSIDWPPLSGPGGMLV